MHTTGQQPNQPQPHYEGKRKESPSCKHLKTRVRSSSMPPLTSTTDDLSQESTDEPKKEILIEQQTNSCLDEEKIDPCSQGSEPIGEIPNSPPHDEPTFTSNEEPEQTRNLDEAGTNNQTILDHEIAEEAVQNNCQTNGTGTDQDDLLSQETGQNSVHEQVLATDEIEESDFASRKEEADVEIAGKQDTGEQSDGEREEREESERQNQVKEEKEHILKKDKDEGSIKGDGKKGKDKDKDRRKNNKTAKGEKVKKQATSEEDTEGAQTAHQTLGLSSIEISTLASGNGTIDQDVDEGPTEEESDEPYILLEKDSTEEESETTERSRNSLILSTTESEESDLIRSGVKVLERRKSWTDDAEEKKKDRIDR